MGEQIKPLQLREHFSLGAGVYAEAIYSGNEVFQELIIREEGAGRKVYLTEREIDRLEALFRYLRGK